jgi:hypothetical protein
MSRDKFAGDGFAVQILERKDARRLVSIGPQHAFWALEAGDYALAEEVTGSIVKVQPPPGASEQQVASLRASLERGHAERVTVQPWSKAKEAPVEHRAVVHEGVGVREVVMQLARKSKRAEQLVPFLDAALVEVGK